MTPDALYLRCVARIARLHACGALTVWQADGMIARVGKARDRVLRDMMPRGIA